MSVILNYRHVLVFPDGTHQDLEWSPDVAQGDLLGSQTVGITPEPSDKWIVTRVEERVGVAEPVTRFYHVEKF